MALFCLSALLIASPVSGQKSSEKGTFGYASYNGWFTGLIMKYEAAADQAEALPVKAQAFLANTRKIHAKAMSSESVQIKEMANRVLDNAEALEKHSRADLVAARAGGGPRWMQQV